MAFSSGTRLGRYEIRSLLGKGGMGEVYLAHDTQLERVVARSGWTPEAVRAVIAQQADRGLRRQAADALIFNERLSLAELSLEVRSLWKRWTVADTR